MPKKEFLEVELTDYSLVSSPLLNKGMSFTKEERDLFHLHGIIPPKIASLKEQRDRSYQAFKNKGSDIEKYTYLRDLQDSNETLFYSLICENLEEMMPIIYTPTVGLGCQRFSHIYRRPRGLFIAYPLKDEIEHMLSNPRFKNVQVIVVSDGERILGLGDQGAGGMGIPIGKLAVYTACAGVHPKRTLPILLDVGTDNPDLINDPLYIGWKHERIRGEKYFEFIDAFVKTVKKKFPGVLLQWEDFAKANATKLLHHYRQEICTFNDDVQGTAAVVLATLLAAIKISKIPLQKHRFVIAGAGSAGCGISNLILKVLEEEGISKEEALKNFFLVDKNGLLTEESCAPLPFQEPFVKKMHELQSWSVQDRSFITLGEVIKNAEASVLIGVSGQAGLFNEDVVKLMAKNAKRPIIFPLSNPTLCSEGSPANILQWSDEKALIGTGSPFADVMKKNKKVRVDQTNNAYIFPGLGLGVIACGAKEVSDSMFIAAAKALADLSPSLKDSDDNLLPPLTESRAIAKKVALAVAKEAILCGVAREENEEEIEESISIKMWEPKYLPYKKINT